jgi:hypothetical protein
MSALSGAAQTLQSKCPANASDFDCTAAPYNFSLVNNGVFYGSEDLPPVGSLLVSDTPGTLTAPLSPTLVWSFFTGGVPATAVAVTGKDAAPESSKGSAPSGSTISSSTAAGAAGSAMRSSTASASVTGSTKQSGGLKLAQSGKEFTFVSVLCAVLVLCL